MGDVLVTTDDFPEDRSQNQGPVGEVSLLPIPTEGDFAGSGSGNETSPDPELVKLARRGDKAAFASLAELYWTPIYCYLLRLLGQTELAADLTQETFFKAFQTIGDIPAKRELIFRPWLYRIATNLALSEFRRSKKHSWFSLDWLNERASPGQNPAAQSGASGQLQLQLADRQPGPAEQILATEESHQIAAVFALLPHDQTILLLLRFYHEMSFEEISQVLGGLRQDAVRARLHRARLAFCRLFEKSQQGIETTDKPDGPQNRLGDKD